MFTSVCRPAEQKTLAEFRASVDAFVIRLRQNRDFVTAVAIHPWITNPNGHIEEILDDPEYLSSMIVYLNALGEQIPQEALHALGVDFKSIPILDLNWLELLLTTVSTRMRETSKTLRQH